MKALRILMLISALVGVGPISTSAQEPVIHGAREHEPSYIHGATSMMVLSCLGLGPEQGLGLATAIRWFAADSIVVMPGSPQSFRTYGMSQPDGPVGGDGDARVYIQKELALNPELISHELIHVLVRDPMHVGPEWSCTVWDGAMRELHPDPRQIDWMPDHTR